MTKTETEIRKKFEGHYKELLNQKKNMSRQIITWREERVREITDYVTEQNNRLDKEHEEQRKTLEKKCQAFITEAASQENQKDKGKIRLLIEQCNDLKIELAELEHYNRSIDYIQVMKKDQQTHNNRNEGSVNETENKPSQKTSTQDNANDTGNGASASRRSSLKPPSARARSPKQQSVETQTSFEHDSSTNSGDNAKPDVKSEDDINDKCPVCFMIFPKSMVKQERVRHANEHYGDD